MADIPQVAAVRYIKAEKIPIAERIEKGLPSTGYIKKVFAYGSVITTMTPVDDPVSDILESLSQIQGDFSDLEEGDIEDVKKK